MLCNCVVAPLVSGPVESVQLGWTNETIVFTCVAVGWPTSDIIWSRDEDNYFITPDHIYSVESTASQDTVTSSTLQVSGDTVAAAH